MSTILSDVGVEQVLMKIKDEKLLLNFMKFNIFQKLHVDEESKIINNKTKPKNNA